jgi:spore germination cell wall hydrolase CwlJ-like protein
MNTAKIASAIFLACSLFFPNISLSVQNIPLNSNYIIKHTKQDLDCLAKNIYFEAKGESLPGKIAVAQVTLNRVLHKQDFNKTICGVVYQKDQFSWTAQPNPRVRDHSQWKTSQNVAMGILQGKLFLEGFDALYFHANYVKPTWRKQRQYLKTIGNHLFYI